MANPLKANQLQVQPDNSLAPSELVVKVQIGDQSQSYRMTQDTLRIGRSKDCDVVLASGNVSRLHCILQRNGNDVVVLDNSTRNGTFVNGSKIEGPMVLRSGDRVQVGEAILQFRRFSRKPNGAATGSQTVHQSRPVSTPIDYHTPDRAAGLDASVKIPTKKIQPRFIIYAVVLIGMILLATSEEEKVDPTTLLTSEFIKNNPVEAYQMIKDQTKKDDPRSEAILKASQDIMESTTGIIANLETVLQNEEAKRVLESLSETSSSGSPLMNFNQKLGLEHFFSGIREYHYQNFQRAESHFREAKIFDPDLTQKSDEYIESSRNRRRMQALNDFRIAQRYFSGRRFDYAVGKLKLVMSAIEKDRLSEPMLADLYRSCEKLITFAESEMGKFNAYSRGTSQ